MDSERTCQCTYFHFLLLAAGIRVTGRTRKKNRENIDHVPEQRINSDCHFLGVFPVCVLYRSTLSVTLTNGLGGMKSTFWGRQGQSERGQIRIVMELIQIGQLSALDHTDPLQPKNQGYDTGINIFQKLERNGEERVVRHLYE